MIRVAFLKDFEGALQNGLDGAGVDTWDELWGFYNSSEGRGWWFNMELAERKGVLGKCDLLDVGEGRWGSFRIFLSHWFPLQRKAGRLLPTWGVLGWCPMTFLSGRSMPLGATKLLMEKRPRCQSLSRERACPSTNWRSSWSRWEVPLWYIGGEVGVFSKGRMTCFNWN